MLSSSLFAGRLAVHGGARGLSTRAPVKSVAFIGLGNMGGFMAKNLLKANYKLSVFDMQKSVVNEFAQLGARPSTSPRDAAEGADVVVTMVPSSPHVRQVYSTPSTGILSASSKGALLIDCSTIDPTTAREVAKEASAAGYAMVDAPVSGGVGGAEKGTLTFMVGGEKASFERAEPVLSSMGKSIFFCGANGNGQVAKICNNMLLAIGMIGTAEAMNLGVKQGMDPELLAKIINVSSGRCWSSETYNPVPGVLPNSAASRGYSGGFGSALMAKDLGLAVKAAGDANAAIPLGGLSNQLYQKLQEAGLGQKDFSVVYKWISEQN